MKQKSWTNEDQKACQACNGACCKFMPGTLYPSDVIRMAAHLNNLTYRPKLKDAIVMVLRTGDYNIDWWEGDPRLFKYMDSWGPKYHLNRCKYLRPATQQSVGKPQDCSWGGNCHLLRQDQGCRLSFDQRPRNCRKLAPKFSGGKRVCYIEDKGPIHNPKHAGALAWIPFQDDIDAAYQILISSQQGNC